MEKTDFMTQAEADDRTTRRMFLGAIAAHVTGCLSGILLSDTAMGNAEIPVAPGEATDAVREEARKKRPHSFTEKDLAVVKENNLIVLQYSFELNIMHDVPNEEEYRRRMTECVRRWMDCMGISKGDHTVTPVHMVNDYPRYVLQAVIVKRPYRGTLA